MMPAATPLLIEIRSESAFGSTDPQTHDVVSKFDHVDTTAELSLIVQG
jgi:hypothetical protein